MKHTHFPERVVTVLDALIRGDQNAFDRDVSLLDERDSDVFHHVLSAAFQEAVVRCFGAQARSAEVIRFVAGARSPEEPEDDIDPLIAERIMRGVLSDGVGAVIFRTSDVRTRTILFEAMLAELKLSDAGRKEFLSAVRARAERTAPHP